MPDFAKALEQMEGGDRFLVDSDPVDVAGFQWNLNAFGLDSHFEFHLDAVPPAEYAECSFEFNVE